MLTTSEIVFYVMFSITLVYSCGLLIYFARQKRAASAAEHVPPTLIVRGLEAPGKPVSDPSAAENSVAEEPQIESWEAKREARTPKFKPFHHAAEHPIVPASVAQSDSSPSSSVIVSQTLEADHYPRTEEVFEVSGPTWEGVSTGLSRLSAAEMDDLFEEEAVEMDDFFEEDEAPTPNLEAAVQAQTRRIKVTDIPIYSLLFLAGEAAQHGGDARQTRPMGEGDRPGYLIFGVPTPPDSAGLTTRELQISDLSSYSERVLSSRRDQTINSDFGGNDEE